MLEVRNPKSFFDNNPKELEEVTSVVNSAFGRSLEFEDIYQHVTSPEQVLLLRQDKRLVAMASYNSLEFERMTDCSCLIVEGIAVIPEMQGKRVFRTITDNVVNENYHYLCLRTQNPRMYRALQNFCLATSPSGNRIPKELSKVMRNLASYLKCQIDKNGVIKGYYGRLFYGIEPTHNEIDPLFQSLGIDKNNGDGLLVVGEIREGHYV